MLPFKAECGHPGCTVWRFYMLNRDMLSTKMIKLIHTALLALDVNYTDRIYKTSYRMGPVQRYHCERPLSCDGPGVNPICLILLNLAHPNDTSTECFSANTTSVHQDLWNLSFLKEDIHKSSNVNIPFTLISMLPSHHSLLSPIPFSSCRSTWPSLDTTVHSSNYHSMGFLPQFRMFSLSFLQWTISKVTILDL